MDSLRGQFHEDGSQAGYLDDDHEIDEHGAEGPPAGIGTDERRMQVRAYNFWAGMLEDRNFPAIEDLEPEREKDFGPYSVLLDFTSGIENPAIAYLGDKLADECGTTGPIGTLDDVPSRSLLSRITDHYLQIIANQAPIGFEAEFVNQRGCTILYRGILLPFSSDDDTIDFIYGVINWKELADARTTDELMLDLDRALEESPITYAEDPGEDIFEREPLELTDWADGPNEDSGILDLGLGQIQDNEPADFDTPSFAMGSSHDSKEDDEDAEPQDAGPIDFRAPVTPSDPVPLPGPSFGLGEEEPAPVEPVQRVQRESETDAGVADSAEAELPSLLARKSVIQRKTVDLTAFTAPAEEDMGLADWLASARELAVEARLSDDRSRKALYAAIDRAYDFALAAEQAPGEFAALVADAGLTVQTRAPLTPLVKLVFGVDYDKTRLTEYATVLGHARRLDLPRGGLADYLARSDGGLKGIVKEERRLRRGEKPVAARRTKPKPALASKLREMEQLSLFDIPAQGSEFTVLVARRLADGKLVVLGEVGDDVQLVERAAQRLVT